MQKINLNLKKHRLTIQIVRKREADYDKPLLPSMEDIQKTKKGSKISRFFRYVFEQKRVSKILGTNLAIALMASSFLPNQALDNSVPETTVMAQENVTLTTIKNIQYPVEKVSITQGFAFFHPGVDLDGITGDPIKPIKGGTVEDISRSKYAYGNAIIVNHGGGLTSLYAHLSKILVTVGQVVDTDTIIGEMGATGRSFGDHLHLEIRNDGVPINPSSVLPFPRI
jgi:murein DD-endopeptidase MepM/ murein hydrolase activator NlpD